MHLPDDSACTHYRAALPAIHCGGDNWTIDANPELTTEDVKNYDAFIFHRIPKPEWIDTMEDIKDLGKKVAWQFDDDPNTIPHWNPATRSVALVPPEVFNDVLELVDMILVSTPFLAQAFHRPEKTRIVPNLIRLDEWQGAEERKDGPVRVLWAGSLCHQKDLDILTEPILRLIGEKGDDVQFFFFGDLPEGLTTYKRITGYTVGKAVPIDPRHIGLTEHVPFRDYYATLQQLGADIGLAPLVDCEFNKSKSNVKWLEYSMLGAATVATSLEPYHCIADGIEGRLVRDENGWYEAIRALIDNPSKRKAMAHYARERIRVVYSWNGPGKDVWNQALGELVGAQ